MGRKLSNKESIFHASPGFADWVVKYISQEKMWKILCSSLVQAQTKFEFSVNSLVLMRTHFHLMFSGEVGKENYIFEIIKQHVEGNFELTKGFSVFDEGIVIERIDNYEQFLNTYRYIYRNPIDVHIVKRAENYQFSSLKNLLGGASEEVVFVDPFCLIQNPIRVLNWINQDSKNYYLESTLKFFG